MDVAHSGALRPVRVHDMSDDLNPGELVESLRGGDDSARDRLHRLCSGPICLLVGRIRRHRRPDDVRFVSTDLTLGRVEMDLRSRPPACFEGMSTRVFLALILAAAYRMLSAPEGDGPQMHAPGVDDELALARFAAGQATEEDQARLSGSMLSQPDLRRWIDTVRDLLDAMPSAPPRPRPAHDPGLAAGAELRERISRYHDAVERYLQLKLGDSSLADEIFQAFWTRLLTNRLPCPDGPRGRFREYLRAVLHRLILDHCRARKLEPPIPEESPDESSPDADFDRVWREALIRRAMSRLEAHEASMPGNLFHTVLAIRRAHPRSSIEDLVAELSRQAGESITPEAFRKTLQRARSRFLELLALEIGDTIGSDRPEDIDDELRDLGLGGPR
jgi:RNA polymerase sigma-70 factor (ECF subfamily)